MGDKTGIQWTDTTWNPIRGCSRVSEGCRNCYAECTAYRFSGFGQPYQGLAKWSGGARWTGAVRMVLEHLGDPMRWRKPRRIFVNSMSDLFHESLTNEQIAAVFGVMAAAPQHTFQVLTKRAKRMREWFTWVAERASTHSSEVRNSDVAIEAAERLLSEDEAWSKATRAVDFSERITWPLPNVWLGVSVENQDAASERIPDLLATPAALRFLSCEPLLGKVLLDDGTHGWLTCTSPKQEDQDGDPDSAYCCDAFAVAGSHFHGIDWVIAGCESGPGARPCEVDWLRSLRDQCAQAGVSFFLKQAVGTDIGRCGDDDNPNGDPCGKRIAVHIVSPCTAAYSCACCFEGPEDGACVPIGPGEGSTRKPGGVIGLPYLDGVQHAAFPEVDRGV